MRSKFFVLVTVLALLLGAFTPALAQDAGTPPPPFCGDLAAEDCAILKDSQAAMLQVAQNTALATFDVTLNGIPGLPADPINVTVSNSVLSTADAAAMAAAQSMAGMSQMEMNQALADDPQPMIDLLGGWDVDMAFGVTMTPELAASLGAQYGVDLPNQLAVEVKLVDGILYWDVSEVAAFAPTVAAGWVGFPLVELVKALAQQGAFDAAAAAMEDPNMVAAGGASLAGVGAQQFLMDNTALLQKYMTIERGEDIELAGQMGATFVTTMDVASFLSGPEVQQMIVELAKSGVFDETGFSAADIEQNVQMLGMMGPMLFGGFTATAKETIGLDDLYQYDYESELAWDMSSLVQMAAASGQLPAELQPTSDNVGFRFLTVISNDNMSTEQSETIAAPSDAQMIPLESLLSVSTAP